MRDQKLPVPHAAEKLAATIDEALGLLKEASYAKELVSVDDQPPASLLDQCLALCAQQQAVQREAVRTVHHFACTGGTLISKCIAAMPNTHVLSEVDPLSTLQKQQSLKPRFAPTDMVTLMLQSTRGAAPELVVELFLNNLEIIYSDSIRVGQRLILRDHAHSHFCVGNEIPERLSFRAVIASRFPTLSVVTVRHPLDSFLSLKSLKWIHFSPPTFDEYCKRYISFLKTYKDIPIIQYENFVNTPHDIMNNICTILELPFSEQFIDLFSVFKLTGDSGRSGNAIEPRPRRLIDSKLTEEIKDSKHYAVLRTMLNYD